jgi:hypothetical protein
MDVPVNDATPHALIASGFGDPGSGGSGGGIFLVDGSRAERIDRISTMGLSFDGERLARILRCRAQDGLGGEAVVYDGCGVQRYLRLDGVGAVHDVAWDGDDLAVVSSWHNAVRWFAPNGRVAREVQYRGAIDKWHLNCITRRDGVWYATMFGPTGPFATAALSRDGAGALVCLTTGAIVARGLTAPHSPRWLDGMWAVCNSARGELLGIDEGSGRVVRRAGCGDWTRGVASDDGFIYVGISTRRASHDSFEHAGIVVLDRDTWKEVDRIVVQAQEIYDLAFVSRPLVDGLRRGFDVNPLRTSEYRQYRILSELGVEQPRTLWPSGEPLPWSDFRCAVACTPPADWMAGTVADVPVRLTNRSASFFTSAPPCPVYVSYKWIHPATGAFLTEARAYRSALPRTVYPGESIDVTARVVVPPAHGSAILRITAIQEGVSWFDDQDPDNAAEFEVEITPGQPTVWEPVVSTR